MMDLGSEIAALEDDMQEFNLEKTVKHGLKTPEELEKLTVDESLNDVDRAVYLLSSGQEVQCISVIRNLPHLLRHWQAECLRRVLPKVKEMLHTAGHDVQLAATEVFLIVAKEDLVAPSHYTQHFLRTIITNIEGRDSVIAQAWLSTLLSVILHIPRDTVKREVLGLAIAKGQLSQPTSSRISCCSILGTLAMRFDSYIVKKDVVHTVKQLCQDVDYEVRASMCAHLHEIAKGLGPEETKKCILDEVLELARDEESSVREAAFEAVLNMTQLLDDDSLIESVIPLVCKYCEQAVENEDRTLLCVTQNFGRLCHNISPNFTLDQKSWLLSCYRYLCNLGYTSPNESSSSPTGLDTDENNHSLSPTPNAKVYIGIRNGSPGGGHSSAPSIFDGIHAFPKTPSSTHRPSAAKTEMYNECRRACAYNLPAMVQFAGQNDFKAELLDSTTRMCTDPDVLVRKSIASGLHEIAQILDDQAYLLHGHLVSLLRERNNVAVVKALISELSQTMFAVMARGSYGLAESKPSATSELINALLATTSRLEQQWPSTWRALEKLVTHMQHLPDVLTSDQIYYKFVPVVFKLLNTNRYLPVKEAAVYTMCVFIRHNRRQEQKKEMCNRLVKDLCYGHSYRSRILFFTACRHMMELFSKSFFKEHLFEHVLNLFRDPVANVRLCLCKVLPSLKSLLKLPSDRALHQQLESSVRRLLSSEKDRDVSDSIRYAILELDRTEVAMESLTQHMFMDEDLQDQKKEEEERMLIEREERSKDDDRSTKSLNSYATKPSTKDRSERSHHHHHKQRRGSKNSLGVSTSTAGAATPNHRVNGTKEKHKASHHQATTQQTPVFTHQKDNGMNGAAAYAGQLSLTPISSHLPTQLKSSTSNHLSSLPPMTTAGGKVHDVHNNHNPLTSSKSTNNISLHSNTKSRSMGQLFFHSKSDRRRSSSLLSHSTSSNSPSSSNRSSPNAHSETRSRKSSFNSTSFTSGVSRSGSKNLQQAAANAKTSIKRKTSNAGSNNLHKKSEKNGRAR